MICIKLLTLILHQQFEMYDENSKMIPKLIPVYHVLLFRFHFYRFLSWVIFLVGPVVHVNTKQFYCHFRFFGVSINMAVDWEYAYIMVLNGYFMRPIWIYVCNNLFCPKVNKKAKSDAYHPDLHTANTHRTPCASENQLLLAIKRERCLIATDILKQNKTWSE